MTATKTGFFENVATMLTGTAVAQAIPVLLSPILTRLFTPEDFALFGLYMALAVPVSIAATGRYEFSVMLPADDEDAMNLVWLTLSLAISVALVALIVIVTFRDPLTNLLGNPAIAPFLYLVPVSVLLLGTYQALNYWCNRQRCYRRLAVTAVAQQGATGVTNVAAGLANAHGGGLIIGALTGQTIAALTLGIRVSKEDGSRFIRPKARNMRRMAVRYKQFPYYNMPYSVVGNFAAGFPIIALTSFGFISAAGFLNLARRVMFAPVSLLSSSLGQVFFQHATVSLGTAHLERLTNQLLRALALLGAPVFVFFVWWAPELFVFIFGNEWREAGTFAAAFSPVAFFFLFTSWPERIYEIAERQRLALIIQVVSDSVGMLGMWVLLLIGVDPLIAVLGYAAVYSGYHFAYLYTIFRIAGFKLSGLGNLGLHITGAAGGAVAAMSLVQLAVGTGTAALFLNTGLLVSYVVVVGRRQLRSLRSHG